MKESSSNPTAASAEPNGSPSNGGTPTQPNTQSSSQLQSQQPATSTTTSATSSSSSSTPTSAAAVAGGAAQQQGGQQLRKSNIHELRNADFVSRLMAATPPYLYSTPVGPNNFFFSDMLRSLVQARNNETARVLQLQQQQREQHHQREREQQQRAEQQAAQLVRRPRKRSWSQRPYYEQLRREVAEEKPSSLALSAEKPLELTTNNKTAAAAGAAASAAGAPAFIYSSKYSKQEEQSKTQLCKLHVEETLAGGQGSGTAASCTSAPPIGGAVGVSEHTPPAASLPPSDLVLPPPPPVWYPPLYAPYGIDPLHFFIDLRVSGHIYDRKKENVSPLTSAVSNNSLAGEESGEASNSVSNLLALTPSKQRHGSAFTVPIPKAAAATLLQNEAAINLCGPPVAKYYDLGESKENNQPSSVASSTNAAVAAAAAAANFSKSGASYMLQHLPRLYSQFAAQQAQQQQQQQQLATQQEDNNNIGDNKSETGELCDEDSLGRGSIETLAGGSHAFDCNSNGLAQVDRDIDVEIIDSIKYRTDGESSRCSSNDEASITQID